MTVPLLGLCTLNTSSKFAELLSIRCAWTDAISTSKDFASLKASWLNICALTLTAGNFKLEMVLSKFSGPLLYTVKNISKIIPTITPVDVYTTFLFNYFVDWDSCLDIIIYTPSNVHRTITHKRSDDASYMIFVVKTFYFNPFQTIG